MNRKTGLKPCPFCGGRITNPMDIYCVGGYWQIICECGAVMGMKESEEEVMEKWNTRPVNDYDRQLGTLGSMLATRLKQSGLILNPLIRDDKEIIDILDRMGKEHCREARRIKGEVNKKKKDNENE